LDRDGCSWRTLHILFDVSTYIFWLGLIKDDCSFCESFLVEFFRSAHLCVIVLAAGLNLVLLSRDPCLNASSSRCLIVYSDLPYSSISSTNSSRLNGSSRSFRSFRPALLKKSSEFHVGVTDGRDIAASSCSEEMDSFDDSASVELLEEVSPSC